MAPTLKEVVTAGAGTGCGWGTVIIGCACRPWLRYFLLDFRASKKYDQKEWMGTSKRSDVQNQKNF